jgi:hypothetical protein
MIADRNRQREYARAYARRFRLKYPEIIKARRKAELVRCKDRIQRYRKNYYQENKEAVKEKVSKWYYANLERVKEYRRKKKEQWRKDHPRKIPKSRTQIRKDYAARCKVRNPKWAYENLKRWRAKNMHKTMAMNMARQARRRQVMVGDLTDIAKVYERARWWRQWFDVVVDHRIPLACNGTHEAGNLQIIYKSENSKKGARLGYTPKVIFQ